MSDKNPVEKDPPRGPCYEYQNDHITAEEFFERIDAVPKARLRELIEEWREQREDVLDRETATDSAKSHRNGVACGMDYCIDELEALLE